MLRRLIHKAIRIEERQIKHLAMLASVAPDEFTREIILGMIKEEAGEAKFWNTVDAAYRGVLWEVKPFPGIPVPGGGMYPGMGIGPGMGLKPFSEQKEEKK